MGIIDDDPRLGPAAAFEPLRASRGRFVVMTSPAGIEGSATLPFYPRVALRYATTIVGFSIVLTISVFFLPDLFFPADHLVPADPFETPAHAKPEWYFLWAYQLPRLVPEGIALALQGVALAVLFALPFIDRGPDRHPLDRPVISAGIALALAALVTLSVLGYLA